MAHTQDHTPPRVIHYAPRDLFAPGDRPLCGNESSTAIYSDDPSPRTPSSTMKEYR